MAHLLPHIDASLNLLSTLLLIAGYWTIRRDNIKAHKACMLSAFAVSIVFLVCYLTNHYLSGSKSFPKTVHLAIRLPYYVMLLTHVVLAAAVPVLALVTIYHGLRDNRDRHRRWARWTFPIWLYVSITGVLIYLMLHHLQPFVNPAA